jgi:parvulin-like peptidyl-prolyl isomerase
MKHLFRMLRFLGAAVLISGSTGAAPAPAPSASPPALFADEVVARGKGFTIKRSQLDDAYIKHKANSAARGINLLESQRAETERTLLDKLINLELLKARATEADRAKARERADRIVDREKAKQPSEAAFNRQILAMGMTPEQFREELLERALAEEVMERELRPSVTIPPEQVRKFYEDNPKRFEQVELLRVRHIFKATFDLKTGQLLPEETRKAKHDELAKLLQRARAGEDFAALAKEFSEDPNSKDKGGETTFGRGMSVPEFEKVSFGLATNQISDIVTTSFGYHVIKMIEKIPARLVEFDKVSAQIKEVLTLREMESMGTNYFARLRTDAGVEIVAPKLP